MATAYLRVNLLMGIPIPHTIVQTSKISVGSLSKIVAALYITGRDSRLKSVIAHPRCLIKKEGGLYATPQGLRNVLIISATPYQWKHMIGQRTCRRNTDETRIVMLYIWQRLYKLSPILFAPDLTGPFCQRGSCMEKQMSCQNPISKLWMPSDILKADYPLLIRREVSSYKD